MIGVWKQRCKSTDVLKSANTCVEKDWDKIPIELLYFIIIKKVNALKCNLYNSKVIYSLSMA